MSESVVYGRNSVMELLRSGREIEKLMVEKGEKTGSLIAILNLARKKHILIQECEKEKLSELSEKGNHQGVVALCAPISYVSVDDILEKAKEEGKTPFLLLLESIQDPHNLGAIIRTAECAGVSGIVLSRHHAVGLSGAASKTAAGALEYMPVAKVSSIAKLIEELKQKGLWIACADMDGQSVYETDLTGPLALVIGGEHEGITKLVKERCDYVVSLPMQGHVNSLNASVAAGILMYEVARKRMAKKG